MKIKCTNHFRQRKKLLKLIMRTFIFLLCSTAFGFTSGEVFSQNTKVHIDKDQVVSIDEVFDLLRNQTDYTFIYEEDLFKDVPKVQLKKGTIQANKLLEICFSGKDFELALKDDKIIIIATEPSSAVLQTFTASGTVMDTDGQPLPGANIVEKGTTNGVTANFDGNFSISIDNENATLVVSYIGFESKEVNVNGKSFLNISLKESASGLEEVIVVGYGSKSKADLTGAVGIANSDALEARPIVNVTQALQGLIPGLTITRETGKPGSGADIQVRGFSSINGSGPLVLIDGIEGDINMLNPDDIKNVVVLKDASAAIYGARASGGVILLTTKSGINGKPQVSFRSNYAITNPVNLVAKPTLRQIFDMSNDGFKNSGQPEYYTKEDYFDNIGKDMYQPHPVWGIGNPVYLKYPNGTPWWDEFVGAGSVQNSTFNVNGGSDNSNYIFSLGYMKEDGIIKPTDNDSYDRLNIRLNYDFQINDKLSFETRTFYTTDQAVQVPQIERNMQSIFKLFSFHPIYTESGDNYWAEYGNPINETVNGGKITTNNNVFNSSIKGIYEILDELKVTVNGGMNLQISDISEERHQVTDYRLNDEPFRYSYGFDRRRASGRLNKNLYKNVSLQLDYSNRFGTAHDLNIMAGISHEENDYNWFDATRYDLPLNDGPYAISLGDVEEQFANGGGNDWAIRSLFSRLDYNYKNKYLLQAIFRYDGSSRFIDNERWGFFPGLFAGWRISEENFMAGQNVIDNLKLKVSWGQVGNQSGIGLYDYIASIGSTGVYTFGDGVLTEGRAQQGLVSNSRTWETIETSNFGLEFGVLNNRLSGSFDWYKKINANMLVNITYPSVLGATAPASNSGELITKGWELSLSWKDHLNNFDYYVSAGLSDSKNVLVDLEGLNPRGEGLRFAREGYPINSYFGWEFDGIIQTQEELDDYKEKFTNSIDPNIGIGDAKYKDLDGNGRLDAIGNPDNGDTGDVKFLGTLSPRYEYNLNIGASYKGFDFSTFWQGVGKKILFLEGDFRMPYAQPWHQPTAYWYGKTWDTDNTDAQYPRISFGNNRFMNYAKSTNTLINASYLRLKNLQVGYSFPNEVLDKIKLQKLRLYVSMQDVLTVSSNKGMGFDPETTIGGDTQYPFTKSFSLGFDISF